MKRFGMAVIGLGVVGRRMIGQAAHHPGMGVVSAWDLSQAACGAARAEHAGLPLVTDARAAIERDDVDIVYVAVPPLAHAEYVRAALAAGKAVFCEKPLGVDEAGSAALVDEVNRAGAKNAVNFVFASSAAVDSIAQALRHPDFDLRAVEIRTRFHQWPRDWQAGATWLSRADQGGFTREVLSHFVYLVQRLLGPVSCAGARVCGPSGAPLPAETAVSATLAAGGVPVSLAGSVGGQAPDIVEARFMGATQELRLTDWYRLERHDAAAPGGAPVAGLPQDPRTATYARQLDQLHAMLSGAPHSLPSFADAFAVQRLIETLLSSRT
jgi:predicted dehydrogenase